MAHKNATENIIMDWDLFNIHTEYKLIIEINEIWDHSDPLNNFLIDKHYRRILTHYKKAKAGLSKNSNYIKAYKILNKLT